MEVARSDAAQEFNPEMLRIYYGNNTACVDVLCCVAFLVCVD